MSAIGDGQGPAATSIATVGAEPGEPVMSGAEAQVAAAGRRSTPRGRSSSSGSCSGRARSRSAPSSSSSTGPASGPQTRARAGLRRRRQRRLHGEPRLPGDRRRHLAARRSRWRARSSARRGSEIEFVEGDVFELEPAERALRLRLRPGPAPSPAGLPVRGLQAPGRGPAGAGRALPPDLPPRLHPPDGRPRRDLRRSDGKADRLPDGAAGRDRLRLHRRRSCGRSSRTASRSNRSTWSTTTRAALSALSRPSCDGLPRQSDPPDGDRELSVVVAVRNPRRTAWSCGSPRARPAPSLHGPLLARSALRRPPRRPPGRSSGTGPRRRP